MDKYGQIWAHMDKYGQTMDDNEYANIVK
jgi:hypothetical protein